MAIRETSEEAVTVSHKSQPHLHNKTKELSTVVTVLREQLP